MCASTIVCPKIPARIPVKREKSSSKKRVPGDVVRHAERDVGAALREVQAQERLAVLVLLHVEHEEQVARGQLARLRVARRPGRHDEAPAGGVSLDLLGHPRESDR